MKIKKHNLAFTLLLIAFVFITQGPNILNNFQMQGGKIEEMEALLIKDGSSIQFPPNDNSVVIFWATWCAPCKLEMKRLQKSIDDGDMNPEKVFAYNPFEDLQTSKKFITSSPYQFQFIDTKPKLEKLLNIRATPTYVWLEQDKIYRMTTGISLINLFWLEYFLGD